MNQQELFESTSIDDICRNKHQGNAESEAANLRLKNKAESREQVYRMLLKYDMTCKELAAELGKEMHTISGRITELKKQGRVMPTAIVRNGCRVVRAVTR